MKLSAFDYNLPPERIAQVPLDERDTSRMMIIERESGRIEHRFFYDLDSCLREGDVLVFNDSKVIPAKLTGTKETGGTVEILLLARRDDRREATSAIWDTLLKPGKRVRIGTRIHFGDSGQAEVLERLSDKKWRFAFTTPGSFEAFLHTCGKAPLPPYIKRKGDGQENIDDLEKYQTIYARVPGSVAAPTAGFHFSSRVIARLARKGIPMVPVTLHVGFGTFLPIEAEDVEDHRMEEEVFEMTPESANRINEAQRVIAVGTTATRVLETLADEEGVIRPGVGTTALFIYPGYTFKRVNGLLTNFHLPKSSLFLLAAAFAGLNALQRAYQTAVENHYRFYSYGDCTLIL
ncbi:MAG: S-adenosylmethionine:tRNA ribosyltransferase-isomerase [Syntrophus sp. SKADARSKE-3]|nr:S-adenosylmethionine:tRNA ribosyltransferase-isomerase [Syntrophus sp. SKADARSKE-3]